MRRVSLILTFMTATAVLTGCTYERTPQRVIEPSYSYRQSDSTLTADALWPVRDTRSARAPDMPRLPRSASGESVE